MFFFLYFISFIIFGIFLLLIHAIKYKNLPISIWKPGAAWNRAFIYFSLCNIIIVASGALEKIIFQPIFTLTEIRNPIWILYCLLSFIYIFFAYWVLWSRMTLTFNRKYYLGPEIVFGFIWGFCTGGILVSIYHLWRLTGVTGWLLYLISFSSMGLWQYFIQDYFWDVYVSPEHDTPKSIRLKTLVCHIPNIAITLGFLTLWNNYVIFIILQTFALLASTIFQKFPAPWAKENFHAPMVKTGIFGLFRGSGYLGKKKESPREI